MKMSDITADDIQKANALVVGSPTHWSNFTTQTKQFIDSWPDVVNKVGAAFATGGAASGGKEHVVTSIVLAMLSHGMVVVGPVYKEGAFRFGASGATAETGPNDPGLSEKELNEARTLGERVASFISGKKE
jgi:NAD(P)H dehydrogenase (quinone)